MSKHVEHWRYCMLCHPDLSFKARAEKAEGDAAQALDGLRAVGKRAEKAERERDEALENYAAEYKLKVGCGSKLIEARATVKRIEALVEGWGPEHADELEAALDPHTEQRKDFEDDVMSDLLK